MNNVENALQELKAELDKHPLIQEYLSLKAIIESDEGLKRMRSDIANLTNKGKLEERDALLKIYNSHPVVSNYEQVREEVINLLEQIKDILSD